MRSDVFDYGTHGYCCIRCGWRVLLCLTSHRAFFDVLNFRPSLLVVGAYCSMEATPATSLPANNDDNQQHEETRDGTIYSRRKGQQNNEAEKEKKMRRRHN